MKPDAPHHLFLLSAVITGALVLFVLGFILYTAFPVLQREGINFLLGSEWSYSEGRYGAFTYISGTIILTGVTGAMAVPVGLLTAIYLAEWAPKSVDGLLSTAIELLVGIPSVIYGIFGFFILEDIFESFVNPTINGVLGFIPIFAWNGNDGYGVLLAASILTIMVLPTMVALSRESIRKVSSEYREASYAVGATRLETLTRVIIPVALPGILTAVVLSLMRAMGETMAVIMLMGQMNRIPDSVFDGGTVITSKILADIGSYMAQPDALSALFALGFVLFVMEIMAVFAIRLVGYHFREV